VSWREARLFLCLAPATYHLLCVGCAAIECGASPYAIGGGCATGVGYLLASCKQFFYSDESFELLSAKLLSVKQVLGRMFFGMLWRMIFKAGEL